MADTGRTHSSTSVAQNVAWTSAGVDVAIRHSVMVPEPAQPLIQRRRPVPRRVNRDLPTSSVRGATSASAVSNARRRTLGDDPTSPVPTSCYRPFQLDPRAPRGPGRPVARGPRPQVRRCRAGRAASSAVSRRSPARRHRVPISSGRCGRTRRAHRLLWWALRTAGPTVPAALNDELMAGYFTDGVDLGDPEVLVERAGRCGLDADAARALPGGRGGRRSAGRRSPPRRGSSASRPCRLRLNSCWSIPGAQDADSTSSRCCVDSARDEARRRDVWLPTEPFPRAGSCSSTGSRRRDPGGTRLP